MGSQAIRMNMIESEIKWIYQPQPWSQGNEASFADGAAHFRAYRLDAAQVSLDVILDTLHAYGQSLARKEYKGIAGLSFLIFWLQRKNLERVLEVNFGSRLPALTNVSFVGDVGFKGTGRGIISHWVAGNVATLAVFFPGRWRRLRIIAALCEYPRKVRTTLSCYLEPCATLRQAVPG